MLKPRVLVMVDWYAPGFKAGGPIRSAVNFSDQLEAELDIYVLTSDRDLGDASPYTGIENDRWIKRGRHQVFYASPGFLTWKNIERLIIALDPEHVYLNSMFSRYFTVYPLLMKRLGKIKGNMILAPRGMLKDSALQNKQGKKRFFLSLFRTLGIPPSVNFHATDERELQDVRREMGHSVRHFLAGNLPGRLGEFSSPPSKKPGVLKLIFVGRLHPIKNLDYLLNVLGKINGEVCLTVIATPEDPQYQERCNALISALPGNISVEMLLNVPHDGIGPYIRASHIFVLPTKGENFGHAIFEALSQGRPVLISDQTPWRNLMAEKAGWDLTLRDSWLWEMTIRELLGWDQAMLEEWCVNAWKKAEAYLSDGSLKQSYLKQFN